jgi:hypothetical protein
MTAREVALSSPPGNLVREAKGTTPWLGVLPAVAPLAELTAPKQEEGGACQHDQKCGRAGAEVECRAEGAGGRCGLRVALADERGQMTVDERREDSAVLACML